MPVNPFLELGSQEEQEDKQVNSTGAELEAMLKPGRVGYIPTPTNTQPELEGSTFLANFKDSTTWGAMADNIDNPSIANLDPKNRMSVEETLALIPDDLVMLHADKYIGKDPKDFDNLSNTLRREDNNKALIAASPWKSFAYSLPIQAIDPINWLAATPFINALGRGSKLLKTMAGTGIATTLSTVGQEAIISSAQQSREAQESFFNIAASGIVGAALGGLGHGVNMQGRKAKLAELTARRRMKAEVLDILTAKDKELGENGLLTDNDLHKMPSLLQKTMVLTELNRLINSPFPSAKQFADNFIEHNYTLEKHLRGETSKSVERDIKKDKGIYANVGIAYQNAYFSMVGVEGGVFKKTRAKLSPHELDMGGFNDEVSLVLTTGIESKYSHVNDGADILRKGILDPIKNDLIELGLLNKEDIPQNAMGYFMQVYNKNKILEEGGKDNREPDFFPYALHQHFKAVRDEVARYKSSPEYLAIDKEINNNKELLKGLTGADTKALNRQTSGLKKQAKALESLKSQRPKEDIKNINKEIKEHRVSIAEINKKILPHNKKASSVKANLSKMQTKLKNARGRRDTLKERLKSAKKESKSFSSISKELNKSSSVLDVIDKNIRGLKEDADLIKKDKSALSEGIKDIKNKISELELSKKPSAEEIKTHEKNIKVLEEKIKKIEDSKKISAKDKKALTEEIKRLKDSIVANIPRRLLNSDGELRAIQSDEMLWSNVDQTIDKILGDEGGTLLNPDIGKALGTSALKERMVLANQESMREWHVTDASKLIEAHIKAMVPLIQMTKAANRHGAKTIPELKKVLGERLAKEFDAHSEGKTGKAAQDIRKKRDSAAKDMSNAIDMLMDVYGKSINNMSASSAKFYQNIMSWNASRFLGYMTISSFPDSGAQVFANGPYRFVYDGLMGTLSSVRAITKRDIHAIGYGLETMLGTRIRSFTEHNGLSTESGAFTRGFSALTNSIGNLSGMNSWNNWQHEMAAHIGINRTLQTIRDFVTTGKAAPKDLLRVAKLGIDREHFKTIYEFTKNNVHKEAMFADWAEWDIKTKPQAEALHQFQSSVGKEIDSIVLTPGVGDKINYGLLDSHTPVGKLLFHFKTFLMSSTNKLLYSGAQRTDDMNMYAGIISMLAMGSLSYVTASVLKGKEPDLSFENLAHESIDKSGLLGIWGEVYNIGSKLLGFGGVSRYQSRDVWGALLGPSGGAVSEIISLMNKTRAVVEGEESLTAKDSIKIMRLFPLQNLFFLDQLSKKYINKSLSFEEPPEQKKMHL